MSPTARRPCIHGSYPHGLLEEKWSVSVKLGDAQGRKGREHVEHGGASFYSTRLSIGFKFKDGPFFHRT